MSTQEAFVSGRVDFGKTIKSFSAGIFQRGNKLVTGINKEREGFMIRWAERQQASRDGAAARQIRYEQEMGGILGTKK